ncbi:MAG: hypothetical protein JOY77_03785 [Alphaproteobacteria bacterium]|nr:hypothetical protein [Alphaproteobacteria bacterium]
MLAINDSNVIAGSYVDSNGGEHAFFGALDGQYQTFDVGKTGTEARAIANDGTIAGIANTNGSVFTLVEFERLTDGTIKKIKKSGSQVLGVIGHFSNSSDKFVGDDADPNSGNIFGYIGVNGKYKSEVILSLDTQGQTRPRGLNGSGIITGFYGVDPNKHGFVLQKGVATEVDYPDSNAAGTQLGAINDNGVAVGAWNDNSGGSFPFTFDIASNTFTPFAVDGASSISLWDINNQGLMAVNTDIGAFVYCPLKQKKCPK